MVRTMLIAALALAVSVSTVSAGAEVTLKDGRVLRGTEIRLAGDVYVIETGEGEAVSIPIGLVARLKLTGGEAPQTGPAMRDAGAEQVAGAETDDRRPDGLRSGEPRTVAGREPHLSDSDEQLRVFGEPAAFPEGVVDYRWTPRGPWKLNPQNNEFAPSRWPEPPLDPTWIPRSAFDGSVDVLAGGRARWQPGVLDPIWWPRDGFRAPDGPDDTEGATPERPGS
jgi:hypothetical protein